MFKDIIEENNISNSSFLLTVSKYSSLDDALIDLPSEYLDYYANNQKTLEKSLKRLKLLENYSPEAPNDVGFSRSKLKIIKKIKYKGEIGILTWDPDVGVWVPRIGKRSIVAALKYLRAEIDDL